VLRIPIAVAPSATEKSIAVCWEIYLDFLRGTLAPFFRASDKPIAIACFRLFTRPPLPPSPDRKVPFLWRCIADFTDFWAPLPYRAMFHLGGHSPTGSLQFDAAFPV